MSLSWIHSFLVILQSVEQLPSTLLSPLHQDHICTKFDKRDVAFQCNLAIYFNFTPFASQCKRKCLLPSSNRKAFFLLRRAENRTSQCSVIRYNLKRSVSPRLFRAIDSAARKCLTADAGSPREYHISAIPVYAAHILRSICSKHS